MIAAGPETGKWIQDFMDAMEELKADVPDVEIDSIFEYKVYISALAEASVMIKNLTPMEMAEKHFAVLLEHSKNQIDI